MRPIWKGLRPFGAVRFRSHDRQEDIADDMKWAEAVLMWSWPPPTPESLKGAPKLVFSGHIDLTQGSARALLARGVQVSVVKRCWSPAVSEMALALILACLRRTTNHHVAMWRGEEKWLGVKDLPVQDVSERQLAGRTVGIVGFGAIGRRLAEFLAPFNIKLLVHDPYLPSSILAAAKADSCSMAQMCRRADIIVLAAAANSGSAHLLGAKEIRAMRENSILINTARAALVDQDALTARLEKGDMFAALDVFDAEPLPANSPLRKLSNVYLTPHRAGGILESVQRAGQMLVDDFIAFSEGRKRSYTLSPEMINSLDG
jgi:phosphoglycerate dehydrogenase-like enzyme